MSAIDQLCPACGLCCNGVLFGDVELQRGDDAAQLAALGVPVESKGRKKIFKQPCSCLVNGLCRIYDQRPQRCRSFDCRVLQRVQQDEMTLSAAHSAIRTAKEQAEDVLRLVRALGDTNESQPLSRRYAAIMAQPMDFAGDESQLEMRGELMLAVARLAETLERDFLV